MSNIVVCADGTWNRPTVQTNVWKLFCALPGAPVAIHQSAEIGAYTYRHSPSSPTQSGQTAYYLQGVGAKFSHNDPMAGAIGVGLHSKVLDGYLLISRVYTPGDAIFIFGFSRGAYTARSLAALIAKAGLLSQTEANAADCRRLANDVWWHFKGRTKNAPAYDDPTAGLDKAIALVGVWDTVGALGIPFFNGIQAVDAFEQKIFDFADLDLSPRVANGLHAVSIDEKRKDFQPSLWNPRSGVVERWFAGVHSDVGGGYPQRGLADGALDWMVNGARNLGLVVTAPPVTHPDPLACRHESCVGLWTLRQKERPIPAPAVLDPGVLKRLAGRNDYRPAPLAAHPLCASYYGSPPPPEQLCSGDATAPVKLLDVGQSVTTFVMAEKWWNAAGVQVSKGQRYRFVAAGCWNDASHHCNADGWVGLPLMTWLRRLPSHNWFHLCLAVSSRPALELKNASLWSGLVGVVKLQDVASCLLPIGTEAVVAVPEDGYLYLFANDAPAHYGNNSGCLDVTITRLE